MRSRGSWLVLVGLAVALTAGASTAQAGKGVKKNGEQVHRGTVVEVHHTAKTQSGTLTIKTHHRVKTSGVTTGLVVTRHHHFTVVDGTNVVQVHTTGRTAANFHSVHKGAHVAVLAHNGRADRIDILHPHHKKKA
jgi:hypothetical protein